MPTGVAIPARMPRKPTYVLRRERLLAWLERYAQTPLRAIVAPAGFGKSVLLAEYAAARPACFYIAIGPLRRLTDRPAMVLCERLGMSPECGLSVESAVAAFETLPPCEIAIDEIDALRRDDREALAQIVAQMPEHVRVILAGRSRESVADPRRLLDGGTALLDASSLAFTAGEIGELAALAAVEAQSAQVTQLARESEGWPLVVAGAIRAAADAGRTLADAMRLWNAERGVSLREMILADAAASDLGPALVRLCSSEGLVAADDLGALERAGLYVVRSEYGYALLRAVASAFNPHGETLDLAALPDASPMFVRLLGEFEVRIGGRRIEWIRRKDAALFKHLVLAPLGRASRSELCELFWPTHDRQQAGQNLRTTCSNIRAALRRCLPESRVDLYFRCEGGDVVLRTDLAATDLAAFTAHVAAAREAMTAQHLDRAAEDYEAARALYRGPLILEPTTEANAAIARDVDESFNEIQRHVTALRRLRADVIPLRSVVA